MINISQLYSESPFGITEQTYKYHKAYISKFIPAIISSIPPASAKPVLFFINTPYNCIFVAQSIQKSHIISLLYY